MFKVEIKDLGENKKSFSEILKDIDYKDLFNLVKPYVNYQHLSFSLPNDCTDGTEWGYIYAGQEHVGQIKITYVHE